jgi:hypothetical protein
MRSKRGNSAFTRSFWRDEINVMPANVPVLRQGARWLPFGIRCRQGS